MAISEQARRERLIEAAKGYLALGMPDHALKELNQVHEPEAAALEFYRVRGEALRDKQQYSQALKAYGRALAEEADDLTVLMGMAWCYKRVDQLARAIATMEEAYQSHSDQPIVLYNLSCYFALAGRKSDALSWLGRALRMEPSLRKLIPGESDFDSLRGDADFQMIVRTLDDVTRKA